MYYRITYFILPVIFFITACDDELIPCGESSNSGIIVQSVSMENYCLNSFTNQEFVIRNQDDFNELVAGSDCDTDSEFPDIDFARYTMLGVYASGTCQVSFIRNVEIIEEAKMYRYSVKVKSCGSCEMLYFSMNWVLVPRLPDDWVVGFVVEQ